MKIMTPDMFLKYLDKIHTNGRFDYENDETKKTIIECMKNAKKREEDYIQIFTQIIARIKHGAGTSDYSRKNGKHVNLCVDDVNDYNMAVFFEPVIIKEQLIIKKRIKIYKIQIVEKNNISKKGAHKNICVKGKIS
jgi:hypothetical protein